MPLVYGAAASIGILKITWLQDNTLPSVHAQYAIIENQLVHVCKLYSLLLLQFHFTFDIDFSFSFLNTLIIREIYFTLTVIS